jgi:hypothetical protein
MFNLKVSEEDLKLILESLLFSSSVDVCADWYKDDIDKIIDLSKRLRLEFPSVPTENVYVSHVENFIYSEENTKHILEYFPELNTKNKKDL